VSNDSSELVRPDYLVGDFLENWRANIPATIQCSAVRPDLVSNLELKACNVDSGVHRLSAYLVWAISNGGGLDIEVIPSEQNATPLL